jgi:hypothetical protein
VKPTTRTRATESVRTNVRFKTLSIKHLYLTTVQKSQTNTSLAIMMTATDEQPNAAVEPMDIPTSPQGVESPVAEVASSGTILEAAFVDPAYSWPPSDGEGKNAIELQASILLLNEDDDNDSVQTTEATKRSMRMPVRPIVEKVKWWNCCKAQDAVATQQILEYEAKKLAAKEARQKYREMKKDKTSVREKLKRKKEKYNRVPEGILIFRLDTTTRTLHLMSSPHSKTNLGTLVEEMVVVKASPSPDRSRRGMILTGQDGKETTLVACEQRTAISWLESMNLMLAKKESSKKFGKKVGYKSS